MMKIVATVALICVVHLCQAKREFEPSVAFVCGRGAMHSTQDDGWTSDTSTDCLEDKPDILAYCKKIYPKLDITNIVEATSYQHVRGWCPLKGDCDSGSKEAFKVRAYRCLSGPFQSDALIVPKACHFDHVLEESVCKDFDYWHKVASMSCSLKKMNTDNFAMLGPCGTDIFTGVEFVCCPTDMTESASASPAAVDEDLSSPGIKITINSITTEEGDDKAADKSDDEAEVKPTVSVVDKYMQMKAEAYSNNEHDAFKLAKKQLNEVDHDKFAKILKDWSEAKARVDAMKKIDPKGAEKLNKEITPRFQKEYFALQLTVDNQLIQLDSTHQQHVQTNLNSKKRKTAAKLMAALQDTKVDAKEITKYMQRYIAIEEKDAHHCVQHYIKLRNEDVSAAQQLLPSTIEHLSLISQRINQSIGMLSVLEDEKVEEEITDAVSKWLTKSYTSVDLMVQKLSTALSPKVQARKKEHKNVVPVELPTPSESAPVTEAITKPATDKPDNFYKKYAEKLIETDFVNKMKSVESDSAAAMPEKPKIVEMEVPKAKMSHMAQSDLLMASSNSAVGVGLTQASAQLSNVALVAIVASIVAALFVISFSIFVIKKRSDAGKSNHYLEVAVDDSGSAEDRHIVSMQNGYENPTYKFLEKPVGVQARQ